MKEEKAEKTVLLVILMDFQVKGLYKIEVEADTALQSKSRCIPQYTSLKFSTQ